MCSYCGCQSIEVVGRFTSEHEEIINAAGDLRRAVQAGESAAVAHSAEVLRVLLDPHTRAEEVGLFRVLRRDPGFTEHVDSLCGEHTSLDAMLATIADGDHTGLDTFVGALRRHIDREENGLFPAAAIGLDGPDWEEVDALTPAARPTPAVPASS
jgi:hypothetical protein